MMDAESVIQDLVKGSDVPEDLIRLSVSTCLLCHADATILGVFKPSRPVDWSETPLKPGKMRFIPYGLCDHHALNKSKKMRLRIERALREPRSVYLGGLTS